MEKLAIHGGKPARSKPLPPNYPGAVLMGAEEADAAAQVIHAQSPFRYYGPEPVFTVKALEDQISRDMNVPYVLGVTSCTAGLIIALKALGIGYGDKVIVPANTFIATAGAVICSNAVPVFVDVDDTLNMDPDDLERVMDDEVKAIIAVPILGNPCDMQRIMSFAEKHNIYVIEDVAQSCGIKHHGRYAGTIGHVGVLSFQMNKILTAGEGGAIITHSAQIFERAARYHDQGLFRDKQRYNLESSDEENAFAGQNYRMSEITGAVALAQWGKLNEILTNMKTHYTNIQQALSLEIPTLQFRRVIDTEGDIGSNLGMILPTKQMAELFTDALNAENINTAILYNGKPVYMNPQIFHQRTAEKHNFPFDFKFKHAVEYTEEMCPRAADLIARTVYLPISPILTEADTSEIIAGIIKVYAAVSSA
ncbi:DegT/DnrJ/EryC1/StrS family aminotransferase [Paenibacillus eucommiae]|uniref:8-amino-3,8-dideoxy-alpha-D-manno-octulosonate transaminase n=1 Tax=Paenibacillus eucommiae TaxID=1355755 RepID=A0ABS4J1T1_9BACL|nr:DegT/DnrJ/EryC1/StrS family aminotransferase [Paenibacillus eucommiae]MBP1993786.1 8-amino-3,8-dideoxy-alpha-D-manno-octulosonate transaminase [Paenibacillus eucommiae]